jgi:hypothetical protein
MSLLHADLLAFADSLREDRCLVVAIAAGVAEMLESSAIAAALAIDVVTVEAITSDLRPIMIEAGVIKGKPVKHRSALSKLALDWKPSQAGLTYGEQCGFMIDDLRSIFRKFRAYWTGNGKMKRDWEGTWRNWVANEAERQGKRPPDLPDFGHVIESFGGLSETTWRMVISSYRKTGSWPPAFGPEPGRPGCRAPASLLAIGAPAEGLGAALG